MNEILDFEEVKKLSNHSRNAFRYFVYSLGSYLVFVLATAIHISRFLPPMLSDGISAVLFFVAFILSINGLIEAIKSIRKKEKNDFKKTVGFIGNLSLILLIIIIIVLSSIGGI